MEEQSNTTSRRIPSRREIARALGTFSPLERLVFIIATLIASLCVLVILYGINNHFLVSIPATGGTLREGIVGTPRYINPLLAASDADRDISALVYRGLMRKDENGNIVPDLAKSYTVSSDGLTYTFVLADEYFQDGTPVTADDVLFTVTAAQNPSLKSPRFIEWEGVGAKAPDQKTVIFTLKQPYAPFLISTTLGILPKHLWSALSYDNWAYSDHNTKSAIGAGPFQITSITFDASGIPETYELSAFRKNTDAAPLLSGFTFHFYANEDALVSAYKNGDIDAAAGIDPQSAEEVARDSRILSTALPRVFGIFFNQSQAKIFADVSVRKAIAAAIDKENIVAKVLDGYGEPISGPVPQKNTSESSAMSDHAAAAKAILEKAGWKLGDDGIYQKTVSKKETQRLSFELATSDSPELKSAVSLIVADLQKAGIEAMPKIYETGSLNQDVIRPRKFQALFFGEVVASSSDLFAFWDSSQRKDPGLNITGYANSKVDKALESALGTLDTDKQASLYASFEKEIAADMPAVFVYSPSFIYATHGNDIGISLGTVKSPEDRFSTVRTWHMESDRVWKLFAKNN